MQSKLTLLSTKNGMKVKHIIKLIDYPNKKVFYALSSSQSNVSWLYRIWFSFNVYKNKIVFVLVKTTMQIANDFPGQPGSLQLCLLSVHGYLFESLLVGYVTFRFLLFAFKAMLSSFLGLPLCGVLFSPSPHSVWATYSRNSASGIISLA